MIAILASSNMLDLFRDAFRVLAMVAAPPLLVVFVVGLLLGSVQSWLGLHDPAVSTAPRLIVGAMALLAGSAWLITQLADFARAAWGGIA